MRDEWENRRVADTKVTPFHSPGTPRPQRYSGQADSVLAPSCTAENPTRVRGFPADRFNNKYWPQPRAWRLFRARSRSQPAA